MREVAEFRVIERHASLLFGDDAGKKLGGIARKILVNTHDPLFNRIGIIQNRLLSHNESFFLGWRLRRSYTKKELDSANLLHLHISSVFEPAGEECGTVYDEAGACPFCGSGAIQVGPLVLNLNKIPKGKDFCKTIAGEIVVSKRVANLFHSYGLEGVTLTPVIDKGQSSKVSDDWFHFQTIYSDAEVITPTRTGIDPFDDDQGGQYRCPLGHLIGLALLSEPTISKASRGKADFVSSKQFIGVRRGLLRPERLILISPQAYQLISSGKLKGCIIEVAHMADMPH